jgi:hypothetical protein
MPFSDDKKVLIAPHHDGLDRFEIRSQMPNIHKHSTLRDYQRQMSQEYFASLKKIVCVRNPWDRCASFFFSPHRGEVSWSEALFEDFISQQVQPHSYFSSMDNQEGEPFDCYDYIIKFENIESDFAHLCAELGLGSVKLPRVNVSRRLEYRAYFTSSRLVNLVAEKFAVEIARFGYSF